MFTLYDASTDAKLGTLSHEELQALTDCLEEETAEDQDYYINASTIDLLEERGAPETLVSVLRQALGEREDMDIRWRAGA